jgi:hypothetical protein
MHAANVHAAKARMKGTTSANVHAAKARMKGTTSANVHSTAWVSTAATAAAAALAGCRGFSYEAQRAEYNAAGESCKNPPAHKFSSDPTAHFR